MQQIETYALKLHATSTDTVQIIKLDLNVSQFFPINYVSAWLFGLLSLGRRRRDLLLIIQIQTKTGFWFLDTRNSKQLNLKCTAQIGKKFVCSTRKIILSSQDSQDD